MIFLFDKKLACPEKRTVFHLGLLNVITDIPVSSFCLKLYLQTLDGELDEKYKKVESLIAQKTEESADARRKAELLQNEAKTLLAQANSKLQLLEGRSFLPTYSFIKVKAISSSYLTLLLFLSTDLERKYEDNQKYLEDKAQELVRLEGEVRSLLKDISEKVAVYSTCL